MLLSATNQVTIAAEAAAVVAVYFTCLCLYRLFFSPLSKVPGPKLAAATGLYEAYHDLVRDGQYPWRIREMHRKYGPVVRVNPREVHIEDADYIEHLYSQRLDKDPWFSRTFGVPLSGFGSWSHDVHRQRRGAINRFFSRASILSRAEVIQAKVLRLCERLAPYAESKETVQLDAAYICLTLDNITEFCCGISYNYLDKPGFDREFKAVIENVFAAGAFNRQVPMVLEIMSALPVSWVMTLMPKVSGILRLQEKVRTQARRIIAASKRSDSDQPQASDKESYHDTEVAGVSRKATVFNQILDSRLLQDEKSEERLVQEGQSLIAAGAETTARALYLGTFHLLSHPSFQARLRLELLSIMPSQATKPSLQELEQLPFLTAIIKESIRLSGSTVTRTARMSPADSPLTYKEWVFPPGTPVSVTLNDILTSDKYFPSPDDFNPYRWLIKSKAENGDEVLSVDPALDKYFVAFSRGPRSCVGMWLAWAELYLTFAHVFREFDMELYQTSLEDVATYCDRFSCFAKLGNNGVRVKVTGLRA